MKILALDTATADTCAGLLVPGRPPISNRSGPGADGRPQHASRVLGLAGELLQQAGLQWSELDVIAAGTGPGGYTGLRIGLATAEGLAQAAGAQLTGVSTLEGLAAAAGPSHEVLAVLDARRGEAFLGAWHGARCTQPPQVARPEDLAALVRPGLLSVGAGAVRWRAQLTEAGAEVPAPESPLHHVDAGVLCRLAAEGRSGPAQPSYLRLPDAEIALRARGAET